MTPAGASAPCAASRAARIRWPPPCRDERPWSSCRTHRVGRASLSPTAAPPGRAPRRRSRTAALPSPRADHAARAGDVPAAIVMLRRDRDNRSAAAPRATRERAQRRLAARRGLRPKARRAPPCRRRRVDHRRQMRVVEVVDVGREARGQRPRSARRRDPPRPGSGRRPGRPARARPRRSRRRRDDATPRSPAPARSPARALPRARPMAAAGRAPSAPMRAANAPATPSWCQCRSTAHTWSSSRRSS